MGEPAGKIPEEMRCVVFTYVSACAVAIPTVYSFCAKPRQGIACALSFSECQQEVR